MIILVIRKINNGHFKKSEQYRVWELVSPCSVVLNRVLHGYNFLHPKLNRSFFTHPGRPNPASNAPGPEPDRTDYSQILFKIRLNS